MSYLQRSIAKRICDIIFAKEYLDEEFFMGIHGGNIDHVKWSCKELKGNKGNFKHLNVKSTYSEDFLSVLTR